MMDGKTGIGEIPDPIPVAFKNYLLLPDLC